jgi:hypothetical protein
MGRCHLAQEREGAAHLGASIRGNVLYDDPAVARIRVHRRPRATFGSVPQALHLREPIREHVNRVDAQTSLLRHLAD